MLLKKVLTNSSTSKRTPQSCKSCTRHALNQVQNSLFQPCSRKLSLYQQTPISRTKILALYLLQISYDFSYRLATKFSGLMNNVDIIYLVCHISILPCWHCHVYAQSHKNLHVSYHTSFY